MLYLVNRAAGNCQVFNQLGQLVLKGSISEMEPLKVSSLPTGAYVLKLEATDGAAYISHFVKI